MNSRNTPLSQDMQTSNSDYSDFLPASELHETFRTPLLLCVSSRLDLTRVRGLPLSQQHALQATLGHAPKHVGQPRQLNVFHPAACGPFRGREVEEL